MEFTNEEKYKILKARRYELMRGYCFSNPTDKDYENHFVSEEEVNEKLKNGAKNYFWNDRADYIINLDEAWEDMLDYLYEDLDTDDDNKINTFLLSILRGDDE